MTTNNTRTIPANVPAFATSKNNNGRVKMALWGVKSENERAPILSGDMDGVRISAFLRQSAKGPFLSLKGEKDASGNMPDLGTANVVVSSEGFAKMRVNLAGDGGFAWLESTMNASKEMLAAMGIDMKAMLEKRKAAKAASAAATAEAEAEAHA